MHAAAPTCSFYDCPRRARSCDLDHDTPWPRGPTSVTNLDPKCRRHHNAKTAGVFKTKLTTGPGAGRRSVRWTLPAGIQVTTSPRAATRHGAAPDARGRLTPGRRAGLPRGVRISPVPNSPSAEPLRRQPLLRDRVGVLLVGCTLVSRSISVCVVSLAETAFERLRHGVARLALLISGSTFCAAKLFFGSVSTTKPFAAIAGSVVKMSAASTCPFFRPFTVSGPPASSVL